MVVTHDRPAMLERCLTALGSQTVEPDALVVVDNASDTDTAEVLAAFPNVTVVRLEINLGGAGGFAAGLQWATDHDFAWSWVMDDDALPEPDALEAMVARSRIVRNDVVGLASRLIDPSAPLTAAMATVEVTRAHFVGLAIRSSAVKRAGLPRDDFFIYTDDTEYCLRLRRGGYKILTVPASRIEHADWLQDPANLAIKIFGRRVVLYPRVRGWRKYYLTRNRILVGHEHGRRRLVIGILQSLAFTLGTLVIAPGDAMFASRGLLDGLRGRSGTRVRPS